MSTIGSLAFVREIAAGEHHDGRNLKESTAIDQCPMELLARVEQNIPALAEQDCAFEYSPSIYHGQEIAALAQSITLKDALPQEKERG